jgi:hypothetical protein
MDLVFWQNDLVKFEMYTLGKIRKKKIARANWFNGVNKELYSLHSLNYLLKNKFF